MPRFGVARRVSIHAALWRREFVIARRANGYGADLDAMFAAQ